MAGALREKTRLSASFPTQDATNLGVRLFAIVAWTGILLVGAVSGFEPLLSPSYSTPASFVSADYQGTTPFTEDRTNKGKVSSLPDPSSREEEKSAQLFSMETKAVTAGGVWDKWRRVKVDIGRDLEIVARCQANEPCPAPARKLIGLSIEGAGRIGRARVGLINRAVDLAITPVSDEVQWGVPDRWSAPFETLQSGRGDCEDYAIVKYLALLEAGISKDDVKIVILKNFFPNEDHAVVAVRVDGQWLIMDNRTLSLVRDVDLTRAIPEFVLDQGGVRRFVSGSRNQRAWNIAGN
jgi:predicted transglutaminase-like cysteine proteinase